MFLGSIILLIIVPIVILTNKPLNEKFNIIFNPQKEHRYTINDKNNYLPLPNQTVLTYRTSDTQCVYKTKASVDEVFGFYSQISLNGVTIIENYKNGIVFEFFYKENKIIVKLIQNNKTINKMYISVY